ncbi:MAG TPA: carboxypeptidase-like regulatory domain-containing protein [Candidatus Dormibacteraeota bacterium]|nr:carboxypeptidase-like regulatory domain-containing protein [Candidatus Dormibacteraeota bacterium]
MKAKRLQTLGALVLMAMCAGLPAQVAQAQAKAAAGHLSGVVRDSAGTPQMGASVEVLAENAGILSSWEFLTNPQGFFRGDKITPGFYTVRVTLAGFLPTIEKHVRITSNLTTVVRIQMESMFASLEQLRRQSASSTADADDWKWVLRSASSTRPVLQWSDGSPVMVVTRESTRPRPRGRLEVTDGSRRPGSISNVAQTPGTAFAYDQSLGGNSRMLFAGQVSYSDDAPAGGIATIWLPTGRMSSGPHTAMVLREAKVSPEGGLTFRGVRFDQGGAVALGDRAIVSYGGEYVLVGVGASASSLRPRMKIDARITDDWHAALLFASQPSGAPALEGTGDGESAALAAALGQLDAFPALLWRNGKPVLERGWHEEASVERRLGERSKVQVAVFHDDNSHIALFGRGNELPAADYFQDFYSKGFAYDGGSSSNWGTRLVLREKVGEDVEVTTVYAYAGALVPVGSLEGTLRDSLRTVPRHSMAATVSAKVPRTLTRLSAGYKWVNGQAMTRVDAYGETLFQTNPYLHVGIRQPLPFALGRWEANAQCDNLLAQGYYPISTRDGQSVVIPVFRSFRGGISWQF